jgi:hypothetical protein
MASLATWWLPRSASSCGEGATLLNCWDRALPATRRLGLTQEAGRNPLGGTRHNLLRKEDCISKSLAISQPSGPALLISAPEFPLLGCCVGSYGERSTSARLVQDVGAEGGLTAFGANWRCVAELGRVVQHHGLLAAWSRRLSPKLYRVV